jgi:hypothetical protein
VKERHGDSERGRRCCDRERDEINDRDSALKRPNRLHPPPASELKKE